jgi:hypothetical protein
MRAGPFRGARALAVLASLSTLGVSLVAGCPGEIENPERFKTTAGVGTCNVEGDIFPTFCADTTCHNAEDAAGMLDLVTADVAARVVGQPASVDCPGEVLADPQNPEDSLLYTKLFPPPDVPCGSQMPLVGTKLTEEQQQCVLDWIAGLETSAAVTTGGGMGGMGGGGGMASGGMAGMAGMGGAGGAGGN